MISKTAQFSLIPFIVGDIHGCYEEFLQLLEKADYSPQKHRLILVGDVLNRGPFSFKVLQWIKEKKVEVTLGNHELLFLQEAKQGIQKNSFKELKKQMGQDFTKWMEWIQGWPLYIEGEDFIVVHAGLVPGEHPRQSDPRFLLHLRSWNPQKKEALSLREEGVQNECRPWYEFYKGKKTVVYGHWAKQGLNLRKNTIGLDTGCVYGGFLSGVFLPERKVVQVKAKKVYYSKE